MVEAQNPEFELQCGDRVESWRKALSVDLRSNPYCTARSLLHKVTRRGRNVSTGREGLEWGFGMVLANRRISIYYVLLPH